MSCTRNVWWPLDSPWCWWNIWQQQKISAVAKLKTTTFNRKLPPARWKSRTFLRNASAECWKECSDVELMVHWACWAEDVHFATISSIPWTTGWPLLEGVVEMCELWEITHADRNVTGGQMLHLTMVSFGLTAVTFSQQWTRHLPVTLDCREQRTRSQLSLHKQRWMTCAWEDRDLRRLTLFVVCQKMLRLTSASMFDTILPISKTVTVVVARMLHRLSGLHSAGKLYQREIIAFQLDNKLCKLGSSLRSKGLNVTCPGHIGCTANVLATEPLSEYRIGKHIGDSLAQDNVAVKYVATDGDALASRGIQDAMPAGMETQRQSDTTHLSQTQFRHIMKASFLPYDVSRRECC